MSTVPSDLEAFFADNAGRIRDELFDFLRIPSVSTRPEHQADIERAAEWVAASLRTIGLTAEILPTEGHPVVLAEWREAPGAPTVLIYGHYDVQPADPLEGWETPPFEPAVRDGRIYARGATDDKGQVFLHLKALEAHLRTRGRLPVNVVVLIEGEEEIGSKNLTAFLQKHADRLRCDAVVISDSTMFAPGLPALLCAARGMAYFQIDVRGPAGDLHSGTYGGAVVNPATALARILATLHDAEGRIAIPGFYDRVREWPAEFRRQMKDLPFDDAGLRAETGAPALGGETGYTTLERMWTRPTCDVHGLLSGYTGEGGKTVIPATAMAKVSCRLVADQDPDEIHQLFRAHVEKNTPEGVHAEVQFFLGGPAWRADLDPKLLAAASRALQATFGREPVIAGDGGSLPILTDIQNILKAPVLLLGFGLPGENAHAPNEWLTVENFEGGMRTSAVLLEEIGALGSTLG